MAFRPARPSFEFDLMAVVIITNQPVPVLGLLYPFVCVPHQFFRSMSPNRCSHPRQLFPTLPCLIVLSDKKAGSVIWPCQVDTIMGGAPSSSGSKVTYADSSQLTLRRNFSR